MRGYIDVLIANQLDRPADRPVRIGYQTKRGCDTNLKFPRVYSFIRDRESLGF